MAKKTKLLKAPAFNELRYEEAVTTIGAQLAGMVVEDEGDWLMVEDYLATTFEAITDEVARYIKR